MKGTVFAKDDQYVSVWGYVKSFDSSKRSVLLGYTSAEVNPWDQLARRYHVGDIVKAKITKLMAFGAFAEIIPHVEGLIHISRITDHRIGKPEDVLTIGQSVDAIIIEIDEEYKRITLSLVF